MLGLAAAALQLLLLLPLVSLLTLPRWLLPPLLLPLLPALLALPLGFLAFNATRGQRRWRLIGVSALHTPRARDFQRHRACRGRALRQYPLPGTLPRPRGEWP